MKKITSYQAAAVLILSRILALSMYNSTPDENTTITAVLAVAMGLLKLILMLFAVKLLNKKPVNSVKGVSGVSSAFFAVGAAGFLMLITDSFSGMLETVYPEHFSRLGITCVLLFICAYVASMGVHSIVRTASMILPAIILVFGLIFFEMRESMLGDRLNLYSPAMGNEISRTLRMLAEQLFDVFLMFGLLPMIDRKPENTVKLYIVTDCIISLIYYMMVAAVLGAFSSNTGNIYFTLSYCTHGSVIDRSGAVFLSVSSACAAITGAALLLILKNSLRFMMPKVKDTMLYIGSAAVLSALLVALYTKGVVLSGHAFALSITTSVIIIAASYAAPLTGFRKELEA